MSSPRAETLARIETVALVPVVRAPTAELALAAVEAMAAARKSAGGS